MRARKLVLIVSLLAAGLAAAQSSHPSATVSPPASTTRTPPLAGLSSAAPPAPTTAPEPPPVEDLTSFEGATARLEWVDRRWQLMAGDRVLKDFGRRESEARQALRLIQSLGLTQRGTVGRPTPVMEYWLAAGAGPQGLTPGLRLLPLDPATLRVEKVQVQWCLRNDQRVLFNFGVHPEEARRALAIIRKYHFSQVGILGQATPSMLLFLSDGEGMAGLSPAPAHLRKVPTPSQADGMPGGIVTAALPPLQESSSLPRAHPVVFKGSQEHTPHPDRKPGLPGGDGQGEWVGFDWRQAQVVQEGGVWKLTAGAYVLAAFGTAEEAARQALAAVRHYRFTEHCRVGQPAPVFSYFLVNGQAPRGLQFGLTSLAFQPDKLSVEALGRQWALCSGDQVLLILGEEPEDARRLLETIRRNQFDRLCRIGPSEKESMSFFVRVH